MSSVILTRLDFQEKTLGQLAPKFSDLVDSKSISLKNIGCVDESSGHNVEL